MTASFEFPPKKAGVSGKSVLNIVEKYNKDNCTYCPWINKKRHFISTYTKKKYRKNYIGDCQTANIIYLITCSKCSKQYVGKSKRQFKERLREHLRYVRNNTDEPTGKHFNQAGHNVKHMTFEIIEVLWNDPENPNSDFYRSMREDYWILQLRALRPTGINSLECSKYQCTSSILYN